MATSGPGAIHLLNGLYDAKLDHVPVLAIVGQTDRTAQGGSYQQEVDLASLFKDVCHHYVQTVNAPQQLPNLLDRAIRTALATHTPTCIILPYDVQELDCEPPGHQFKMVPSSLGISWPRLAPDDEGIRRAAEILNAGNKVAILVGQGARGARGEVTEVADTLGAGVAKALLGKDVLSDDLPVGDRLPRLARHPPELRVDDGVRHPADRRLQLPLHPVPAQAGPGPGHPDRPRRVLHRYALPVRGEPGVRRLESPYRPSSRC